MRKPQYRYLFALLGVLLISLQANSQIIAPYVNFSDTAEYVIADGPDSVFVFNAENDSTFIMADTQNYKGYTVNWAIFEVSGAAYNSVSTDEKMYFTPGAEAIGYRLTLTNATETIVARCWVVRADFGAEITSKENGDTLETSAYINCEWLYPIKVELDTSSMKYYNPTTSESISLHLDYDIEWEKEIEADEGRMVRSRQNDNVVLFRLIEPYYEHMWYYCTITDDAGLERHDSVYVKSYVPHAEFSAPYVELEDKAYYPGESDKYYIIYSDDYFDNPSAPAMYRFISSSVNAIGYEWFFQDTSKSLVTDADSVLHTYHYCGLFEPYLVAKQTFAEINMVCYDTSEVVEIDIEEPAFEAPNAFTPPNGLYPYWRFYEYSIIYFEIYIYNRYGKKVHEFEGDIRDWEGWDGRYKDSDNIVPTGVYYYVVRDFTYSKNIKSEDTKGPEELSNEAGNKIHKGYIHVFNTE